MFSDRSAFPGLPVKEYTGAPTDVLIASDTNPWVEVDGQPINWVTTDLLPPSTGNDCDACGDVPIPGVLTDMNEPDGIQRCDTCARFDSDLAAAKAAADRVGGRVMFYAEH